MGKKAKKKTIGRGQSDAAEEAFKGSPHTLVIHRGLVGKNVGHLVHDFRRVMEPFTASKLKVRKKNVLKDFINVAGFFNISHIVAFSKTESSINMRMLRTPRGPTMTFKVHSYSLAKDVISTLKRHNMEQKQFQHHPLLVMNNFSGEGMHIKLMATMFQNMFPSINVNKVKLNDIRRCVLVNYNPEDKTLDFRHFHIKVVPVGMSRPVKKLIKAKVPNMSNFEDIADYITKGGNISDSEGELDGPHNEVVLPQTIASRGNIKSANSAIRLTEIGPRMKLQLIKIEEGLGEGNILFHEYVTKTEEEVALINQAREKKRKLKMKRKTKQELNVKKKTDKKDEMKKKTLEGMKKKAEEEEESKNEKADSGMESDDSIGDAEYFKQEVGEAPDPELFPMNNKQPRKRQAGSSLRDNYLPYKKKKLETTDDRTKKQKRESNKNTEKVQGMKKFSRDNHKKNDVNKKNKLGTRVKRGKKVTNKKSGRRR
ncbi:unnamed protein product [Owenia fusiformis]|uniref:Uncharacterized protein n=1 Tax=Owenia fusiformis TaxID=6347 RepID=A0A8J1U803_OWEFU|nr:unnamed protein product [Owenia fusiformis]